MSNSAPIAAGNFSNLFFWRQLKASTSDQTQFFRVIRRYHSAGISIRNSVELYNRNCRNAAMKAILEIILKDMRNGQSFPDALRKHPFFSSHIVELIGVAQTSGQMRKVFDEIVFFLEQEKDIDREVNTGLYPAKFFIVGALIAAILAVFVLIPKMSEIMTDLQAELPLITSIVLKTGLFITQLWPLLILLALGGLYGYQRAEKVVPEKIDRLKLKIPFFGTVEYYRLQYKFTKILALILQSGIKMKDAIRYTAVAVDNIPLKTTLHAAASRMQNDGSTTVDALRKADQENLIDPDLFVIIGAGEESGNMNEILLDVAEDYRKELLALSKNIGTKVGTSIIIPGIVVMLFIMASIYLPLLRMMNAATTVNL